VVNGLRISEVNRFREKIGTTLMFQLPNDSGSYESFRAGY
jgi:hypothetical protein